MSEQELERQAKRRLQVIRHAKEVTGNVAQTCRYYGISRQTYYCWLRRYEEFGLAGLRDRSKTPKVSPWATPAEVVTKIVYLRSNYHFGPQKIPDVLEALPRHHDLGLGDLAHPQAPRHEPAAELAALQAAPSALETL